MAKSFRELATWQLAFDLQDRVRKLLSASPRALRDFTYRDQLMSAARSVPANIAEGFGRFRPAEMARYIDIARGSLDEAESHLRDGVSSGYFTATDVAPLIVLSARCRSAMNSWHSYLRRMKNPRT